MMKSNVTPSNLNLKIKKIRILLGKDNKKKLELTCSNLLRLSQSKARALAWGFGLPADNPQSSYASCHGSWSGAVAHPCARPRRPYRSAQRASAWCVESSATNPSYFSPARDNCQHLLVSQVVPSVPRPVELSSPVSHCLSSPSRTNRECRATAASHGRCAESCR